MGLISLDPLQRSILSSLCGPHHQLWHVTTTLSSIYFVPYPHNPRYPHISHGYSLFHLLLPYASSIHSHHGQHENITIHLAVPTHSTDQKREDTIAYIYLSSKIYSILLDEDTASTSL